MANQSKYLKPALDFLYRLMLFLAVFDGIRSRTPIADQVTIFKEICTFSLLFFILASYGSEVSKKTLYLTNGLLLLYLITIGTIVIMVNDVNPALVPSINRGGLPSPFAMHFKNIESFLAIFVLIHYEFVTGRRIKELMNYFVILCIAYILLTIFAYFVVDLSSFFQTPWYGRISIGYPTSDAQILSLGVAYLLFVNNTFSPVLKGIYITVLVIGVLMNATATSLISLVITFFIYFLFYIFSKRIKSIFSWRSFAFIIIVFLGIFLIRTVFNNISEQLNTFSSLFETKLNFVTEKLNNSVYGQEQNADINNGVDISEQARQFQINKAFIYNNDWLSLLFGGPISIGTLIENENYFLLRSYGYGGLFLYYIWILGLLLYGVVHLREEHGKLIIVTVCILLLTNMAIITSYLFGIAVPVALFISFCTTDKALIKGYN